MTAKPLQINTRDGVALAATLYEPGTTNATATTVIVNSGVAVRRRFYDGFARYLCENGFTVITYDYRGIGDSLSEPITQCGAQIADWGTQDFPAVIDAMSKRFPQNTIKLVGHSFGGQILGVAENNTAISAMLSIASQSGYWKHWPVPLRYAMATLWFAVMPGITTLLSYFPSKRLNMGENLPAGVAQQWARWCRHPDYLRADAITSGDDYFDQFHGKIRSISFGNDRAAPGTAVDALHAMYTRATVERVHIEPSAAESEKIGHFGFFRLPADHEHWRQAVQWLAQRTD